MSRFRMPPWFRPPYIVETLDRDGKRVVCSRSRWIEHIQAPRPEMRHWARHVAHTIMSPDEIRQDVDYPQRRVLYKRGILPAPFEGRLLKVVVEYPTITFAHLPPAGVVTAYAVDKPKAGEELLWPLPITRS